MNKIGLVVTLEYRGDYDAPTVKESIAHEFRRPGWKKDLLSISTMEEVDLDAHGDPDMSDMVYRHGEWVRGQQT